MAIVGLKARLAKLTRRHSTSVPSSLPSISGDSIQQHKSLKARSVRSLLSRGGQSQRTVSTAAEQNSSNDAGVVGPAVIDEEELQQLQKDTRQGAAAPAETAATPYARDDRLGRQRNDLQSDTAVISTTSTTTPPNTAPNSSSRPRRESAPVTEAANPHFESDFVVVDPANRLRARSARTADIAQGEDLLLTDHQSSGTQRPQSLFQDQHTALVRTLLEIDANPGPLAARTQRSPGQAQASIPKVMAGRKMWVRRPGASATQVTIHEDDLVDDVRDMVLKKYSNSLGRSFDSPDVTLRIVPRENRQEKPLGPEEPIGRALDTYFPGGQSIEEALVIDVPLRRTPKPSPRGGHAHHHVYYSEESRPIEAGTDYFPPMPASIIPSPLIQHATPVSAATAAAAAAAAATGNHAGQHSMSVLTTGHVPNLPSPGGSRRHARDRPRIGRQHTSSPTMIGGHISTPTSIGNGTQQSHSWIQRSRTHSSASEKSNTNGPPTAPPLPTPPAVQEASQIQRTATPPPRVSSPRSLVGGGGGGGGVGIRPKKSKKGAEHPSLPAGLLTGAVPPINVLIVEDNIINLKLLEAFMKRLKVRWQTAMNGREAVTKWRAGGFHLVLMDIQLPVMSGLEATREIRRLERLNAIGVFPSSAAATPVGGAPEQQQQQQEQQGQKLAPAEAPEGDDRLPSTLLFKSPVIIVALTASSLQSDRHEALAAGCNDFLTKPVNFVWLERKVMEWGCMQALIDFDGWRKWKDFSQKNEQVDAVAKKTAGAKAKPKKTRTSLGNTNGNMAKVNEESEDAKEI